MSSSDHWLYSEEGLTQGYPFANFVYAVGTMPLISSLKKLNWWVQVWYADDQSACARLDALHEWYIYTSSLERPDIWLFSRAKQVLSDCTS